MRRVVPSSRLSSLIEPRYPAGKAGRPPFPIATMLQIHFMQPWFGLSDPAMEEALYDVLMYREFARLDEGMTRLPDEITILRFRDLLETHGLAVRMPAVVNEILKEKGLLLKTGVVVGATLISTPSSTKNTPGTRHPKLHQTQKGNPWCFGMKAHIGQPRYTPSLARRPTVHDHTAARALLHGAQTNVYIDAGVEQRSGDDTVLWRIAMRPGRRRQLDLSD